MEEELQRFKAVRDASDPHGVDQLYQVTSYRGQREDSRGKHQDLTIEVQFNGEFHVEVSDEKGRVAWGIHHPELAEALATIGWDDLDEDSHVLAERGQRACPGSWSQSDVRRQSQGPEDPVTRGR
jgi:hypothetical protein